MRWILEGEQDTNTDHNLEKSVVVVQCVQWSIFLHIRHKSIDKDDMLYILYLLWHLKWTTKS